MVQLSGVLITYNEEKHIEEAIRNISFADEIIVVDSFSTDKTIEKLKNFPQVKVIQRAFTNFPEQRNFAMEQAKGKLILFLDADERIPKKLQKEIAQTIVKPTTENAYYFKRRFVINGRTLRFSGLQTDKVHRLIKNGKASYNLTKPVHEQLLVEGESGILQNYLQHYFFDDYASYKQKKDFYAELKAQELFDKNKKPTFVNLYLKPIYKFIYNYIFRLGILDGKAGYMICHLKAYGVWYRYKCLEKLISASKT